MHFRKKRAETFKTAFLPSEKLRRNLRRDISKILVRVDVVIHNRHFNRRNSSSSVIQLVFKTYFKIKLNSTIPSKYNYLEFFSEKCKNLFTEFPKLCQQSLIFLVELPQIGPLVVSRLHVISALRSDVETKMNDSLVIIYTHELSIFFWDLK